MKEFDPQQFIKNLSMKEATEKLNKVLVKNGVRNSMKPTIEDIREYQGLYNSSN